MRGATLFLSAGFILEEGCRWTTWGASPVNGPGLPGGGRAVGDKRYQSGQQEQGDGVFINTAGLGLVPPGVHMAADRRPGDAILLSGTIGDHGIAIMSVREG